MFMISKFMYDSYYKSNKYMDIEEYKVENHIENFYYFRLGAVKKGDKIKVINSTLTIPPNGFNTIWSLERFSCSQRVLGLFGNLSSLVEKGLQLIHSPSIDPGFIGNLSLGIKNNTSDSIDINVGDKIGKILFFDVSDSFVSVEKFLENSLIQKDLELRRNIQLEMQRASFKILKKSPNNNSDND